MRVPVVDARGRQLMPCRPARARLLIKQGKAVPKWNKLGIFYIQLIYEVEPNNQPLVFSGDSGTKFEGFSVVGTKHTVLNIMSEAVTHVKESVKQRAQMRRSRRYRKTRQRPKRFDNRRTGKNFVPPSIKARYDAKLRILKQLMKILPISHVLWEDVKAVTKPGQKKWNSCFSPIQAGKEYFYQEIKNLGVNLLLKQGYETKALRKQFNLRKSRNKGGKSFRSHCVDAWVLAASVSGAEKPDCTDLYYLVPIRFHRRQLHRLEPDGKGVRKPYGGTRSIGLKRGTLVKHPKWGLCYVGGTSNGFISLHNYRTGKRVTQCAKVEDCKVLTSVSWRCNYVSGESNIKSNKRR